MTKLRWLRRLWPRVCPRHHCPFASDFCPECIGERLAQEDVIDGRIVAHPESRAARPIGDAPTAIGIAKLIQFDAGAVRRHVRAGRRNDLHRQGR